MTITTMSEDPWKTIPSSNAWGEYKSLLVPKVINPSGHHIYWARGTENHRALLVEYGSASNITDSLPEFKSINVKEDRESRCIVIELLDSDMTSIFLNLCLDLISALQKVTKDNLRKACILRLNQWAYFLRPDHSRLSPESQKGLIAELRFLQHDALELLSPEEALEGWTGPEAGPRDYAYGQVFIEVKSKRSSATPNVVISSEAQLNVNPSESLFLYVLELNEAPSSTEGSFTITDVVNETRELIDSPIGCAILDNKLAKVGYFDQDDYSNSKWSEGEVSYYAVTGDFPRIDSQSCCPGISRVNYQIDLDYCNDYLVDQSALTKAME